MMGGQRKKIADRGETVFGKGFLKEREFRRAGGVQAVGELGAVVGLDTRNGIGKRGNDVAEEHRGRVGAYLIKSLQIAEPAVLIQESVAVCEGLDGAVAALLPSVDILGLVR